ncbi:hypothetical protein ABZ154_15045 [Streptomyces sp. NPDC006261]|uniref:hypothetical protein n=1 Tax=Streptomyces sp. NPDC006261 TaxID=3156739 RepID=UPI0033A87C23
MEGSNVRVRTIPWCSVRNSRCASPPRSSPPALVAAARAIRPTASYASATQVAGGAPKRLRWAAVNFAADGVPRHPRTPRRYRDVRVEPLT